MNACILVVDTDRENLKLMERLLSSAGHTVSTSSKAEEALELSQKTVFDMVITDIAKRPGFDGLRLVRDIKAFNNAIEVLVLSGSPSIHLLMQALQTPGISEYLQKPLNGPEQLLCAVERAITRHYSLKSLQNRLAMLADEQLQIRKWLQRLQNEVSLLQKREGAGADNISTNQISELDEAGPRIG